MSSRDEGRCAGRLAGGAVEDTQLLYQPNGKVTTHPRQPADGYGGRVTGDGVSRSVDAALVPMVASLGAWGVEAGHWLPDRAGAPVIWLRTRTLAQSTALQSQVWLVPQVQVTLTRFGVPHDIVWSMRVEVTSTEAEDQLFRE
ncbi:hypothetical protein NOCA2500029 [metagenome]|uniref:Uncharacterized protein n=1 Tax=metagenome TaxID=256318 RepID=A0A2P2C984_9ZZZZ